MADREDKVYKAKLAEQAERYDGKNSDGSSSAVPVQYQASGASGGRY